MPKLCSLKSVVNVYGEKTFHLGCLSAAVCNSNATTDGSGKCHHCCSTDLCNSYGCGEAGNFVRNSSICYQCDGQIEGEPCHKVAFCDSDEKCFISEETWLGEKYFRSGCRDRNLCQSVQYPYPVVGKRDYAKRSLQRINCCIGDLCNHGASFNDVHTTVAAHNTTSLSAPVTASKGTAFILLFTEGYALQSATAKVIMVAQHLGQMSVYNFANNNNHSLQLMSKQNEFSLDHNVFMTDGQDNKGVELHGNVKAAVFGLIYNINSGDGFSGGYLGIPSNVLSNHYIIPSFKVYSSSGLASSMFAITPRDSTATVQLSLKMKSGSITYKSRQFGENDTLTVVLNNHETFEISHISDLTGTSISSSSPIAVVSGNKCNSISGQDGCNTFIEMVLPVEQLDQTYIIPYIATRTRSTVRVISIEDTTIKVKSNNQQSNHQLLSRGFFDFYHDTISFVSGTADVSVMIYPHEIGNDQGDAFMMTIHGINQYLTEYDFVVPSGFTSFISVTVETRGLTGLILDGNELKIENIYTTEGNNISYISLSKSISSGAHRITHLNNIPFGLWVYGNAHYDAYGYPAGIGFKTITST